MAELIYMKDHHNHRGNAPQAIQTGKVLELTNKNF